MDEHQTVTIKYQTVIVWADFMAPGLWVPIPTKKHPHATMAIEHDELDLPEELSKKIYAWISSYWETDDHPDTFDCEKFNAVGAMLAAEIQKFVGRPHEGAPLILFRPELPKQTEEMRED